VAGIKRHIDPTGSRGRQIGGRGGFANPGRDEYKPPVSAAPSGAQLASVGVASAGVPRLVRLPGEALA